jgi:hypothetical protein
MSHGHAARIALSMPSLLTGAVVAGFALFTNALVWFAPPPHCEMMCPLLALTPTATAALWSIWLVAWCIPAWRMLGKQKRILAAGCLAIASASVLMLFAVLD